MNRLFLNVIQEGRIEGMALGELRGGAGGDLCICDNGSSYSGPLCPKNEVCLCNNGSKFIVIPDDPVKDCLCNNGGTYGIKP